MQWIVVVQVLTAIALGAAIGLEREVGAQPAGLRTHMLVSLGAAVFTLAGIHVMGTDPTRVAAQVVTGIGFLGGGAIFKEGVNIRGLTTAASLWVTAAIGLAVGLRAWLGAIVATVLALAVLWLVKVLEREWLPRRRTLTITLTLRHDAALDVVERAAVNALPHAKVLSVSYAHTDQSLLLSARARAHTSLPELAETLRHLPGVEGVALAR
jgi:putative Mg2+ transporter-C (MgtC) family protein